ncbi:MAG: hypothetical protein QG641_2256 [Candidatus Poribacteria bacterium]|nr:hypothetical protein [Euryarchaeota archaeon]MDQ1328970.1 hypothetical protein [Candidatus Poribacteria bacterium]
MAPKEQNLRVIGQDNNGNGNGNGNQTEEYSKSEKKRPHLDERFIINIKGKNFVLYSGLLDMAHQIGLKKLEVNPLQLPTKDNGYEAICLAVAETEDGKIFKDVADCNPSNCSKMVASAILRIASVRSKARCLRDMVNVGMTALEEIFEDEVIGDETHVEKPAKEKGERAPRKPRDKESSKNEKPETPPPENESNGGKPSETSTKTSCNNTSLIPPKMSNAQRRALENLSRRKGISLEELDKTTREAFNSSFDHLSSNDASELIRSLQQTA